MLSDSLDNLTHFVHPVFSRVLLESVKQWQNKTRVSAELYLRTVRQFVTLCIVLNMPEIEHLYISTEIVYSNILVHKSKSALTVRICAKRSLFLQPVNISFIVLCVYTLLSFKIICNKNTSVQCDTHALKCIKLCGLKYRPHAFHTGCWFCSKASLVTFMEQHYPYTEGKVLNQQEDMQQ